MSMPLIECVVSRVIAATGKSKTEKYLIDALSITEVEARMIEQMDMISRNEFYYGMDDYDKANPELTVPKAMYEIKSTKKVEIEQVLGDDLEGDYFYEFKVGYEPDGSGKKFTVLVQSESLESALRQAKDYLSGWAMPCYISKIAIANVLDLFKYSGPMRENDPNRQLPLDFNDRSAVEKKVEELLDNIHGKKHQVETV